MEKGEADWPRRDHFSLTVLRSPLPPFPNLRSITWKVEDNASTLDVLLAMLPPQLEELDLICDIHPGPTSLRAFFDQLPGKVPHLKTLRLESIKTSLLGGLDAMMANAILKLRNLHLFEFRGYFMPPCILQALSYVSKLDEVRMAVPEEKPISDERVRVEWNNKLKMGKFSSLTRLGLIASESYARRLFKSGAIPKTVVALDVTLVNAQGVTTHSLSSLSRAIASAFPDLKSLALQDEHSEQKELMVNSSFLGPLHACQKLEALTIDFSIYQFILNIDQGQFISLLCNWPRLQRLEISNKSSYLTMGSLLTITRQCRDLRVLTLPVVPFMDGINVCEGQDFRVPSYQDVWRAPSLQKLFLDFCGHPVTSPLEMATYLDRICPSKCRVSGYRAKE